jgi:putative ABC transport system permease protein
LALLVAGLGMYGITAFGVTQRRGEIGIRMALGAGRSDVIRLAVRRSIALMMAGMLFGIAGAVTVTRYISALLFGVEPLDPFTFILVPAVFLGIATLAAFVPARRAAMVEPLVALRNE